MNSQLSQQQIQHQIWLKCMQMTSCTKSQAQKFIQKCLPYLNHHLTPTNQTLLMIACSIGSLSLVQSILSHPCLPHLTDTAGRTALHYCSSIGNLEIFQLLISFNLSPLTQTIGGQTPLSKACLFCQGDIIQWYLNNCIEAFQIEDYCGRKGLDVLKITGEQLYEEVRDVYEEVKKGLKI